MNPNRKKSYAELHPEAVESAFQKIWGQLNAPEKLEALENMKQQLWCRKCNIIGREHFEFPNAVHHKCKECGAINTLTDRVTIDEKTGEVLKKWKKTSFI